MPTQSLFSSSSITLPSAWSGFLANNTSGTSCLGPLAGLQAQQQLYRQTVLALGAPLATTLVLVTRADAAAFREAARTSGELAALGVKNQHLVINGVFHATDATDFRSEIDGRSGGTSCL